MMKILIVGDKTVSRALRQLLDLSGQFCMDIRQPREALKVIDNYDYVITVPYYSENNYESLLHLSIPWIALSIKTIYGVTVISLNNNAEETLSPYVSSLSVTFGIDEILNTIKECPHKPASTVRASDCIPLMTTLGLINHDYLKIIIDRVKNKLDPLINKNKTSKEVIKKYIEVARKESGKIKQCQDLLALIDVISIKLKDIYHEEDYTLISSYVSYIGDLLRVLTDIKNDDYDINKIFADHELMYKLCSKIKNHRLYGIIKS